MLLLRCLVYIAEMLMKKFSLSLFLLTFLIRIITGLYQDKVVEVIVVFSCRNSKN